MASNRIKDRKLFNFLSFFLSMSSFILSSVSLVLILETWKYLYTGVRGNFSWIALEWWFDYVTKVECQNKNFNDIFWKKTFKLYFLMAFHINLIKRLTQAETKMCQRYVKSQVLKIKNVEMMISTWWIFYTNVQEKEILRISG